jgi:hypothetical protein
MRFSSRLLVFLGLWPAAGVLAADVYRCTGPSGEPMFSQSPCAGSGTSTSIRTGPPVESASGLRGAELDWLARRERERAQAAGRRPRSGSAQATGKPRGNDCERRRLSLDDINARLRRGYKPAQGERLKQRRRVIEDYIDTMCRR